MALEDEVRSLRAVPLFAKVDAAKLKLLAFTSERLEFAEGEILFEQGDSGTSAYIVLEGEAEVLIEGGGGQGPIKVATLGQNDIIGEIAMLTDVPRTATIRAGTRLVALKISKDVFLRLVRDFPEMGVEIMRELARRLNETTRQLQAAKSAASGG